MIRKLNNNDFNQIITLLEQLTIVGYVSQQDYNNFINSLNENNMVYVIEINNIIVACGTLLIEPKLIHGCSKVGHIEDIVVDNNYRKQGYGLQIIQHLIKIAKNNDCYKIILDCDIKVQSFYEKSGFKEKNIQMALYFNE